MKNKGNLQLLHYTALAFPVEYSKTELEPYKINLIKTMYQDVSFGQWDRYRQRQDQIFHSRSFHTQSVKCFIYTMLSCLGYRSLECPSLPPVNM